MKRYVPWAAICAVLAIGFGIYQFDRPAALVPAPFHRATGFRAPCPDVHAIAITDDRAVIWFCGHSKTYITRRRESNSDAV